MPGVLLRAEDIDTWGIAIGDGAEPGVTQLQTKENLGAPRSWKGQRTGPLPEPSEGLQPPTDIFFVF